MSRGANASRIVPPWLATVGYAFGAAAVAGLVVLAVRADSQIPGVSPWSIGLDVAVGLAFVAASALAPGTGLERGLVAAAGVVWLIGSFVPDARLVHQAVLLVALTAFPSGRPSGVARWLLVCSAAPLGLLLVPQPAAAVLFTATAATALSSARRDPVAAWYPVGAASGVAVVLAASWSAARLDPKAFDPSLALLGYELVLLAVASCFPIAARAVVAGRVKLTNRLLGYTEPAGLAGLAAVLRDVLHDPALRVYQWRGPDPGYVDEHGRGAVDDGVANRELLYVGDGTTRVGAIEHRLGALDDEPTAAAVSSAVRLAVVHQQLQEQLIAQLDDLEEARARLVVAADRQRAATAERLREDVVGPLERAVSELRAVEVTVDDGDTDEPVAVVVDELITAADEIVALVRGVPPFELGGGRLRDAVETLAQRSPIPVTVTASPLAAADPDTETTLFYLWSEVLTNAVKHAAATRIIVAIEGDEHGVSITVVDDGRGGADACGSGLHGLADRVASRGGRLRVDSPPGAGTTVTATVPR